MFLAIVDTVRARLTARGFTDIVVDEGIEARIEQSNFGAGGANRVVFTPAPEIEIIPPMRIGEDTDGGPRQLLNTLFTYEVAIAAHDPDQPERDLAHRHKAYDIWELVVQEVQLAYPGVSAWTAARWSLEKRHLVFGAELIATLVINVPLFDVRSGIGYPSAKPGAPKPV
jgi:hypothetical protein